MQAQCPFCQPDRALLLAESAHALALPDGYPLVTGHTLVVPRTHTASVFSLASEAQADLWQLVAQVRDDLLNGGADGVNVGINDGVAAGQTVMHAHVHVIPRRIGDVIDPRGGVRWIYPEKADYWSGRES